MSNELDIDAVISKLLEGSFHNVYFSDALASFIFYCCGYDQYLHLILIGLSIRLMNVVLYGTGSRKKLFEMYRISQLKVRIEITPMFAG